MNAPAARAGTIDFEAIKSRQQAAWSSGDYAVIGVTLQIVGEALCEALDLRSTHRVLDVAAGNGNATLAAARRFCDVVSTDYVPALLERAKERSAADRLPVVFQVADVENLPFPGESFDVVLSTFGVMFAPNHGRSASEMLRVLKRGGKIGMANWTPESFVGQIFKTVGQYLPPAAGLKSPALWGTEAHLEALFGEKNGIATQRRHFAFRYKSPKHWLEVFKGFYGPVLKAFAALDPSIQSALETDLLALAGRFNTAADGTLVAPSEYLEVVVTKKG
ncbi:MAG TPA: methyltransferase domain-containing protein [Dongiaceae bacterium]|jgi:ubiquinone/menaquinone biosynthesis C-methylase UbiE|nr:methyltransferase domain-containing protein [Dongiaceae bacterium]